MKISMGTWAFSFGPYADDPVPFDTIVRRLASAGYDGVEVSGFAPHISLEDYPAPSSRRDVARLLKDLNLGVSGYSADLTTVNPTADGTKQDYLDLFQRNVEVCVDIGSPSIRVDTAAAPGSLDDEEYDDASARLAETWREAAEIASEAGILVVWEYEPGFAFNKPSEVLDLHGRVGHESFKLVFDTAHAYTCAVVGARQHGQKETLRGGVAELLKKLGERIGSIHIVDADGTLYGDETSTHRPFGEGKIGFAELAPQLLLVPNVEWWCVDLCFCAGAWDLVEPCLGFVKALLAREES